MECDLLPLFERTRGESVENCWISVFTDQIKKGIETGTGKIFEFWIVRAIFGSQEFGNSSELQNFERILLKVMSSTK